MGVRLGKVKEWAAESQASYIAIYGKWLHEAGFEAGKKFVVEVVDGVITIKIVEDQELTY